MAGWKLDKNKPICPQITDQLCAMIASGIYPPESKLPSVREFAVEAGVNPNTVQKAFEQAEQKGLIYSVRGTGWFVSKDDAIAKDAANGLINEKIEIFFNDLKLMGLTVEEIKEAVRRWGNV